jgi:hypothetical protein
MTSASHVSQLVAFAWSRLLGRVCSVAFAELLAGVVGTREGAENKTISR